MYNNIDVLGLFCDVVVARDLSTYMRNLRISYLNPTLTVTLTLTRTPDNPNPSQIAKRILQIAQTRKLRETWLAQTLHKFKNYIWKLQQICFYA